MTNSENNKETNVHGTAGGEMPDANAERHGETEANAKIAFSGKTEAKKDSMTDKVSTTGMTSNEKIAEPKGDLADQAQSEIDDDLKEQIYQARNGGKPPVQDQQIK